MYVIYIYIYTQYIYIYVIYIYSRKNARCSDWDEGGIVNIALVLLFMWLKNNTGPLMDNLDMEGVLSSKKSPEGKFNHPYIVLLEFLHRRNCPQLSSVAQSCPTLCNPMNRSMPGLPVHHQLPSSLKLMSIVSVMPSSHLILCRPLLLLLPIPPSIRVFSNESTLCMSWPKYWSFSFSISPSNEHPGLISFRMVWLDLLAVQGTLKSLLQHHSSKASILQHSAVFTVISHIHT